MECWQTTIQGTPGGFSGSGVGVAVGCAACAGVRVCMVTVCATLGRELLHLRLVLLHFNLQATVALVGLVSQTGRIFAAHQHT